MTKTMIGMLGLAVALSLTPHSSQAGGAWILWYRWHYTEFYPDTQRMESNTGDWKVLSGEPSHKKCVTKLNDYAAKTRDKDKIGMVNTFIFEYLCLPETVDPRERLPASPFVPPLPSGQFR
jgi:hypothetical protein